MKRLQSLSLYYLILTTRSIAKRYFNEIRNYDHHYYKIISEQKKIDEHFGFFFFFKTSL